MPRVLANGIEIEYEETGSGEPLLLVMGLGTQLIHWNDDFVAELAARGFRVIRFDNRDAGLSTHLDDLWVPPVRRQALRALAGMPVSAPYTLSDMAADTVGLMDAIGLESAHLMGVSMGGMIAQMIALDHPERVRSLTSIMSTPGGRRDGVARPRALKTLLARPPRSAEEAQDLAVRFSRIVGSVAYDRDEDYLRGLAARAYERAYNPRGFGRQFVGILASGSRRHRLPSVRAPTLVIHGTADPLVPPTCGRATARLIPGARLRMVEGMGHDLPRGVWPLVIDSFASLALG